MAVKTQKRSTSSPVNPQKKQSKSTSKSSGAVDREVALEQYAELKQQLDEIRETFLADGVLDAGEKDILDRIEQKLETLKASILAPPQTSGETGSETTEAPPQNQTETTTGSGGGTTGGQAGSSGGPDSTTETTETPPPVQRSISGSVGKGGKNVPEDVTTVQQLLNQNGASLQVDGVTGPKTNGAISKFQRDTLGFQDGLVEPGGKTWDALSGGSGAAATAEQPPAAGGAGAPTSGTPDPADGGSSEPPTIPEAEEQRIRQIVDEQIPEEVPIVIGEGDVENEPLAIPEIPFARDQEISVGCPFGEIAIKFNERGQIVSAAVSKPIIPGVTVAAGAYGILGKVEAKPYSGKLTLSKPGGDLKLELELAASGSGFIGLGAGKGDAWAGFGIDIEVKVARTETVTATLALETLKAIAMSPTPLPGMQASFTLPAKIVLSGSQSLVLGGSAPKGLVSHARKITLKEYNPMATLLITDAGGDLDCEFDTHEGLNEMVEDVGRTLVPQIDMFFRFMELADEVSEMVDDPEKYAEEKIRELEELRRKLQALPGGIADLVSEELRKLDNLEGDIRRQLEEWGEDLEDAYEEAEEYLDEKIEEAKDAYEEAEEFVDEKLEEAEDYIDERIDEAEEALEEAEEFVDEKIEEAEDYLEEKYEEAEDAYDEAEEYVDEKLEEAEDALEEAEEYLDDKIDEAGEKLEEAGEALEDAYDDAEETYEGAKDAVEDKAEELWDDAVDFFSDDDD